MAGRQKMGHGLHQAFVRPEGTADQLLPVAGDRGAADTHPLAGELPQLRQLLPHPGHRVPFVGTVVGPEQAPVFGDQGQLGGGGAAVDAQPGFTFIRGQLFLGQGGRGVTAAEGFSFLRRGEQGGQPAAAGGGTGLLQLTAGLDQGEAALVGLRGVEGGAQSHGETGEIRQAAGLFVQPQGLPEAAAQTGAVIEGPAQKEHVALDAAALSQAGDGLIHHRLIDAGRHVGLDRALIEQGLHVAFGEHAAAGGHGIEAGSLKARLIHLVHGHVQQHGHLVDEGAGAAGAGAVHALIRAAAEKDDLGVLAAQLDGHVGLGPQPRHRPARGVDLLHEGQARPFGQAQSRGTGQSEAEALLPDGGGGLFEQGHRALPHLGKVPFVAGIYDIRAPGRHQLHRGGADIQTQREVFCGSCHFKPF